MIRKRYEYIYGPVNFWSLGTSLGIDPISKPFKVCSFDCLYCQLGRTKVLRGQREMFVPVFDTIEELKSIPKESIDYISFCGAGEPTLAGNLGRMIEKVKAFRPEKLAVITNSSLLANGQLREELLSLDKIIVKLDAADEWTFKTINRPVPGVNFKDILEGIKQLRREFKGELAVQVMFVKENRDSARGIAKLARFLNPDEIQINTPLLPCASRPLEKSELARIKGVFEGRFANKKINIISVYDPCERFKTETVSSDEIIRRSGKPVYDYGICD